MRIDFICHVNFTFFRYPHLFLVIITTDMGSSPRRVVYRLKNGTTRTIAHGNMNNRAESVVALSGTGHIILSMPLLMILFVATDPFW